MSAQPAEIARFDNSYSRLPARFYARCAPVPVAAPTLLMLNVDLAAELGLSLAQLSSAELARQFSGNVLPAGAEPLALAYAGHQFGHFSPRLGDGRAVLLGEVIDRQGRRRDLQLKGSGPTPFSRRGDGRAALGPVLREYLVSEAMHALGVPTTRALAAVATGERVQRETPLPGGVLTRVAASHLRVGTFEYFAAQGDTAALQILVEQAIDRHYPAARADDLPALALLRLVVDAQARLVARWMALGFIHGVMNTDNMSVSGETLDFGPCAFMEAFDPDTVFSAIDENGRYAYANQPHAAHWNLARLAGALLPVLHGDPERALALAQAVIEDFPRRYEQAWLEAMRAKLGLASVQPGDRELVGALFDVMQSGHADFTLTFRLLADLLSAAPAAPGGHALADGPRGLFDDPGAFDAWATRWRARLAAEAEPAALRAQRMRLVNPAVIPRNHHVEAALRAAVEQQDLVPFRTLLSVTGRPFDLSPEHAAYAQPASPEERVLRTFCGT